MAITVATLRTDLQLLKRDITDVSGDTFIKWCDYVNKFIYRKLIGTDPERLMQTQDYTVTESPNTQALPSGFRDINTYQSGFYYIDENNELTERRLARTGPGQRELGYYISGSNVTFTGFNSTENYRLRYIPEVSEITATTDTFDIPDEFNEYLLMAVDVLYNIWDEQPGAESLSDARFIRELDEFILNTRKEPGAYNMPDFSYIF